MVPTGAAINTLRIHGMPCHCRTRLLLRLLQKAAAGWGVLGQLGQLELGAECLGAHV